MKSFIYDIPTKVYFGKNQLSNLGKEVKQYGSKVLLCYGGGSIKKMGLYDEVINYLKQAGLEIFELDRIQPNPRVDSVREGAKICKENKIDVVLAVGGGSVIDCAKFIAAANYYDGDAWDLSTGKVFADQCLPLISILTLSATGSEMDTGGVISNPETNEKLGAGSPAMRPKVSFLDPTLTYSVSEYQTACGSVDIFSHIIEVYFSLNPRLKMLDGVMEALMKTVIEFAPIALKNPSDYEARANLMWTSSWAINGFVSNGSTHAWSCHPMEHELSAFYDITHGLGLAILTPRWMEYTLNETTVDRFYQYGVNVFGIDPSLPKEEVAKKSIACTSKFFFETLELDSTLTKIGIDDSKFDIMAKKACKDSILQGFQPLDQEDIKKIYQMCL